MYSGLRKVSRVQLLVFDMQSMTERQYCVGINLDGTRLPA